MKNRINKILSEVKSLFILIVIILTIKVTIFEMYIVPTGSMENTIMTGDFLVGNRFVYGMNTPDRVGVMDLAFNLPSLKFPSFKEPKRGDVIIFKFPRDTRQKYVKRCIAGPGDILEIRDKIVHINDQPFPLANNGKFVIPNILSESFSQNDIFLGNQGNKDQFKKLRIPQKGDRIDIDSNNLQLLIHVMLLDGHEVKLVSEGKEYPYTMDDPNELFRRKSMFWFFKRSNPNKIFSNIVSKYYPRGNILVPWQINNRPKPENLLINNRPISEMKYYEVQKDYFWAMGDNRDDSLDSRYWGFIPRDYILGEALFSWFSLNLNTFFPRFDRIGNVIQ
ncbi:MAG: hypothetical protein CMG44_00215 [Candidatus Marinimicrobia bacterium]|nr:hypothetical protein [Candidatus Neomarinimicrobiota bacterium]|tara:strand:+ start:4904 stop:5908 length:1005 start_codon:yes stop_codon:yes gene_type:complete